MSAERPTLTAPAPTASSDPAAASTSTPPSAGGISDHELSALVATPGSAEAASPAARRDRTTSNMEEALARANVERLEKQWAMTEGEDGEMIDLVLPSSPVPSVRRVGATQRIKSKLSDETNALPGSPTLRTTFDAGELGEGEGIDGERAARRDSFESMYVKPSNAVARKMKVALGVAEAGPLIFEVIVAFYLQFYLLEQACVSPYALGAIHLTAGLLVALVDIFVFGALTARGPLCGRALLTAGGRPKVLLIAPVVLAVGYFLVWSHHFILEKNDSVVSKFFYFAPLYVGCAAASSAIRATVATLHTTLSRDYDQRTTMAAYRVAWSQGLALAALGAHAAVVRLFESDLLGEDTVVTAVVDKNVVSDVVPDVYKGFEVSGYALGAAIIGSGWFAYYHLDVPAEAAQAARELKPASPATNCQAVHAIKASRPFLWLLVATFCGTVAMVLFEANLIMFKIYRIGGQSDFLQIVLVNQAATIFFMPFYCWTMQRFSKHAAYYRGSFVMATALFILFFIKDGGFLGWHIALFSGFVGSASCVVRLIPSAMLSSVADEDHVRTDLERRPQLFEGMFALVQKIAVSIGFAVSGFALVSWS